MLKSKQKIIDEQKETISNLLREKKERQEKELAEKNKKYSATVYCRNCQHVNNILIPAGMALEQGDCVNCRTRGYLLFVRKIS